MKNPVTRVLLGAGLLTWALNVIPVSGYAPSRFPQSAVLSAEDIGEAVFHGRNGDVYPYLINRRIGGAPGPKAVVYTPFVRVALAAKAGVLTFDGSTVSSRVAPQWIATPEVLVVIGSPCPGEPACEFGGEVIDPIATSPIRLYIRHQVDRSRSSVPAGVAIPVRVVPLRDLSWLGAIPVTEPVVAATFHAQEFRAGSSVVAEWGRLDRIAALAGGHLQETELANWR